LRGIYDLEIYFVLQLYI